MQINIYHNGGGCGQYKNIIHLEIGEQGELFFIHRGENGLETIQTTLPYKIIMSGEVKPSEVYGSWLNR